MLTAASRQGGGSTTAVSATSGEGETCRFPARRIATPQGRGRGGEGPGRGGGCEGGASADPPAAG